MSDMLKKLIEERANVWEQTKQHLDTVEKEGREFTGESDETYTRLNTRLSEFDTRIAELRELDERNKRADEVRAQYATAKPAGAPETTTDEDVLRSIVNGERRSAEFRDLTVGTATAGGDTVPTSFYGQLLEHMVHHSAIRQSRAMVLPTDGGENLEVPKTTGRSSASIIAEGGAITESDPAFGQVVLGSYKYGFAIQMSTELEQDTGVNLTEWLARQGGDALGDGTGAHYVTGTGTGQPQGIITAAPVGVTGATGVTGAFTFDNLIDLFFSVIPPYRTQAEWLFSDSALKTARKLKDNDGQYLWQPSLVVGEPDTILGKPVLVDPAVPAVGLSAKSVAFGDMSTYCIRDVRGVRVERSTDFAFGNDLVTWRFLMRTDGKQIDTTGSIKVFQGAAT